MKFSRSRLFAAAPAVALAGTGLTALMTTAASAASAKDVAVLNSAIPLERAGIKAYQDAASLGILSAPVLEVAKGFMTDHMAHRDALIAAVKANGGTPSEETTKMTDPS